MSRSSLNQAWLQAPSRLVQRGIGRNSLASVGQAAVQICTLFVSYRILIGAVGLEGLGLWALLMVFNGAAGSIDISGAGSLARFLARHDHEFAGIERRDIVHTVLRSSLVINGLLAGAILFGGPELVRAMLPPSQFAEAVGLLPWVAAFVVGLAVTTGIMAALDGVMRADVRALVSILAAVTNLAVTAALVPRLGLTGFAIAQTAQVAVSIVAGWTCLRREIPGLGWLPIRWNRQAFRLSLGFGLRLNVIGVFNLLLEPAVRVGLNQAGGTLALGFYELASKLVVQLRGLALAGATPSIPVLAASHRTGEGAQLGTLLAPLQAYALGAGAAVFAFSLAGAPLLSLFMIGTVSPEVLKYTVLLALGWTANVVALPHYLAAQAQGVLRWNMVAGAAALAGAVAGGLAPGALGIYAVPAGLAAGLLVGSGISLFANAGQLGVRRWPGKVGLGALALAATAGLAGYCVWKLT